MRIAFTAVLLPLSLALGGCGGQEPNDANIGKAVRERMGGAKPICLLQYVKLEQATSYPVDEVTAKQMADLGSLGLIEVEQDGELFMLHATAKAQPFVQDGQLCLAQYRYGKLKSLADKKVTASGLNTVVAHITPVVEPAPNVPPHWLDGLSNIKAIRGMTAEMIETEDGWRAVSEDLY